MWDDGKRVCVGRAFSVTFCVLSPCDINNICCPIYKKSVDKIVEDRTCSSLADKIGRFLHDTRQICVRRFCRQRKSADFVVRSTSPLVFLATQHLPPTGGGPSPVGAWHFVRIGLPKSSGSIQAHSMEDHGYNLRQRPFPVTISEQSSLPISTSTADSLATIPPGTGLDPAPT